MNWYFLLLAIVAFALGMLFGFIITSISPNESFEQGVVVGLLLSLLFFYVVGPVLANAASG